MKSTLAARAFVATLAAVCLAAPPSSASESSIGFVNVGALFSGNWGRDGATGVGAEASFSHWLDLEYPLAVGAVVQAESYAPDDARASRHGRFAAGLEAGNLLGVELGYAYRAASGDAVGTSGVHLGFFSSVGWLSLGFRSTLIERDDGRGHGSELGIVLALKVPIQIYGDCMKLEHIDLPLAVLARCD